MTASAAIQITASLPYKSLWTTMAMMRLAPRGRPVFSSSRLLLGSHAAVAPRRWVETVSGIDTPAKNKVLPWEQRVMPTTKTFYGEETIHNTFTSGSVEEAKQRSLQLVRDVLKWIPRMNEDYELDVTRAEACAMMRREFAKSAHIKDAKTMDVLTFKGRQHLEEVKQQYKVKAQLAYFFEPPDHSAYAATHGAEKESTESDFLQKFYAGTA